MPSPQSSKIEVSLLSNSFTTHSRTVNIRTFVLTSLGAASLTHYDTYSESSMRCPRKPTRHQGRYQFRFRRVRISSPSDLVGTIKCNKSHKTQGVSRICLYTFSCYLIHHVLYIGYLSCYILDVIIIDIIQTSSAANQKPVKNLNS